MQDNPLFDLKVNQQLLLVLVEELGNCHKNGAVWCKSYGIKSRKIDSCNKVVEEITSLGGEL